MYFYFMLHSKIICAAKLNINYGVVYRYIMLYYIIFCICLSRQKQAVLEASAQVEKEKKKFIERESGIHTKQAHSVAASSFKVGKLVS